MQLEVDPNSSHEVFIDSVYKDAIKQLDKLLFQVESLENSISEEQTMHNEKL